MEKKKNGSQFPESHPRIIKIEDQEIEEKKPPVDNIVYYKIINNNSNSKLEEK
ncbi:MAG: hypothetical protein ACFFCY_15315 [Promethearchaeota archaeon]